MELPCSRKLAFAVFLYFCYLRLGTALLLSSILPILILFLTCTKSERGVKVSVS